MKLYTNASKNSNNPASANKKKGITDLEKTFYVNHFGQSIPVDLYESYKVACEIFKRYNVKRLLDIGAGEGDFLSLAKKLPGVQELYGIDISEKAVRRITDKGYAGFVVNVDCEKFPFEDDFFDGIFCGEVIEHLYDPDHLLMEIYRVLRSKGICIITTPNLASWYNRIWLLLGYQPLSTEVSVRHPLGYPVPFEFPAGHLRSFTLKALLQLLKIHNFKIETVKGFGVNIHLGYGKRFKLLASIANKLFSRPSLSSYLFVVVSKPYPIEGKEAE